MAPAAITVQPAVVAAGGKVTIKGSGLGAAQAKQVSFQLKLAGRKPVAAPKVVATQPNTLVATVPSAPQLGSGGRVTVVVGVGAGRRTTDIFVNEVTPPGLATVTSTPVVPKSRVAVTGTGFGLDRFGVAAVVITAKSGARVNPSKYLRWTSTRIEFEAPDPPSAHDTEPPSVTVNTHWGSSNEKSLLLDYALGVATTTDPPAGMAGDVIRVAGRGFGYSKPKVTATPAGGMGAPVTVRSPRRDQARLLVPQGLGAPGTKITITIAAPAAGNPPAQSRFVLEGQYVPRDQPVVLFPVRLETRFVDGDLLVRIYPDDIHVDSFEPELTDEERADATAYRSDAGDANRTGLWRGLVDRYGAPRARYLAHALDGADPGSRPAAWSRAPRTGILPTRWHVYGWTTEPRAASAPAIAHVGKQIPDPLPVGPDPTGPPPPGELDDEIAWMVGFETALDTGMAVRIPLDENTRNGLARLVVVGVKARLAPREAGRRIAAALKAHAHTRGLGFLEEGTSTNNTEQGPSGFRSTDSEQPPPSPPGPAEAGTNRALAARALGFDHDLEHALADAEDADGSALDGARRAMNNALWPVTWRYFATHMVGRSVPSEKGKRLETAGRAWFVDHVRGCGPLPILRVGNQPYALLAVTPLARFERRGGDVPEGLLSLLKDARPLWQSAIERVPRVGRSERPPEQELLDVLAMQPVSATIPARQVLGARYLNAAWRFLRESYDAQWTKRRDGLADTNLEELGPELRTLLGGSNLHRAASVAESFDLPGPLVQGSVGPLDPNYIRALRTARYRAIRDERFADADRLPARRPLLCLLLRHAILLEYVYAASGGAWYGGEDELVDVDQLDDEAQALPPQPWDYLGQGRPQTRGAPFDPGPAGEAPATPLPSDYRESLATLEVLPAQTLQQLVSETLDLCSHRYDAWAASLASSRAAGFGAGMVELGGYGFVENIVPRAGKPTSAGFVHGPSHAHAVTAAVLASGYLTHANDGPNPLAVDLSSDRARAAERLLEAVRNGQPLGASLGYDFERLLQEKEAASLIDDYRSRFSLTLAAEPDGGGVNETVSAGTVVDGLAVQRAYAAHDRVTPEDWPGAGTSAVEEAVGALDAAVDACSDALVAEGVYQMVRGNTARVAAAFNATADIDARAPELEVTRTPRSGIGATHRLIALMPGVPPEAKGWAPTADDAVEARAAAEPALNAWAGAVLGNPNRVALHVRYLEPKTGKLIADRDIGLEQLTPSLSPLDVVHAAIPADQLQRAELEERFAYTALRLPAAPAVADVELEPTSDPSRPLGVTELAEVARSLREAFAASRPIAADDLSLPEAPGQATIRTKELSERASTATTQLGRAVDALAEAVSASAAEPLRQALLRVAAFGVGGAIPQAATGDDRAAIDALLAQAVPALAEARRRHDEATRLAALDAEPTDPLANAAARMSALFGPAFRALPRVEVPTAPSPTRLDPAFASSDELLGGRSVHAATWFERVTRVRGGARRLGEVLTYSEALGGTDQLDLKVAQLPAEQGQRWIGLQFTAATRPHSGGLSIVATLPLGPIAAPQVLAGAIFDEWTEVLPSAEETTALAFQYDRPNSAAPQAILIAAPPRGSVGQPWTLDDLTAAVNEAFDLARLRMVDLDSLPHGGHYLPAIYLAHNAKGATIATDLKAGRGVPAH